MLVGSVTPLRVCTGFHMFETVVACIVSFPAYLGTISDHLRLRASALRTTLRLNWLDPTRFDHLSKTEMKCGAHTCGSDAERNKEEDVQRDQHAISESESDTDRLPWIMIVRFGLRCRHQTLYPVFTTCSHNHSIIVGRPGANHIRNCSP